MSVIRDASRIALRSAADSTATAVGRGIYPSIWNYRDGYVATTDPVVATAIATGVVWMSMCAGVAVLLRAFREAR